MYTRRFFIISLAIPMIFLLFAALVAFFASKPTPEFLGAMLVPYLSFFLFFYLWASKHRPKAIRYAAYRAPLVFLAFQISYLGLEYYHGASLAKDIVGLGGVIIIISTYVILIGYLYVFLMEQSYFSYLFYSRQHHMQQGKFKNKRMHKNGHASN